MIGKIPQIIVTLSPEGDLQMEQPINGVRRVTGLGVAAAGAVLLRVLKTQKREIDGAARAARAPKAQPDWQVIARHPQVEIRQMLPGRGVGTDSQVIKGKTLEELGL